MIRAAEATDAPAIERIARASFDRVYAFFAVRGIRRADFLLVAEDGSEIAGFLEGLLFEGTPRIGYIYFVAVDPGHRRRGEGRALVRASLEAFRTHGTARVFAAVPRDNKTSKDLFDALGFEEVPRRALREWYGWRGVRVQMRMVLAPHEILFAHTFTDLPLAPIQKRLDPSP